MSAWSTLLEKKVVALEVTVAKLEATNAELLAALQELMAWQVKNVDAWDSPAYDRAAAIIKKATGEKNGD